MRIGKTRRQTLGDAIYNVRMKLVRERKGFFYSNKVRGPLLTRSQKIRL